MTTQSSVLNEARPVATRIQASKQKIAWDAVLVFVVLIFLALFFIFPLFWTLSSSLKKVSELSTYPPTLFPAVPQWQNYTKVIQAVPYGRWFLNSIIVVSLSTLGSVLTASLVAYSFARFRYRGRELFFTITLATLMIPSQITLIPQYVLFHKLGWINTLRPLWIPSWFGGGAFAIFLIRQFIMTLPRDLDEAALIDGASYPRIFWRILMPLCKPVLATMTVISFVGGWNDFVGPVIYLQLPEKYTLAAGLNYFRNVPEMGGEPTQHLLMAASVMMVVPIIILFLLTQRYFVRGIVLSGIKG